MLRKNVLSLISLLFLGNQLAFVSADCTFTAVNTCDCSSCDNVGYYAVFSSNSAGSFHTNDDSDNKNDGKLMKVTNTAGCTCTTIGTDKTGFFKSPDGKVISNDYEGKAVVLTSETCSTDNSGKLSGTDICLGVKGSDSTTQVTLAFSGSDNNHYLVEDKAKVFSNANDKSVVVSVEEFAIVVDKTYTSDDYCVDQDTKIVTKRPENYCSNNENEDCDNYVNCNTGVCSQATIEARETDSGCKPSKGSSTGCKPGYYVVDGNDAFLSTHTDTVSKVYSCGDDGSCNDVTDSVVGFLKNADTTHATAIPYIVCDESHACSVIQQPSENSCSKAGTLIYSSGYKLCIDSTTPKDLEDLAADVSYLVAASDYANNNFINSDAANSFVIVKTDTLGNAILVPQNARNYYAAKADKTVLTSASDNVNGSLYKSNGTVCVVDTTTIGYLINAASNDEGVPYIKCSATGTPDNGVDTNSCIAINKPDSTKAVGALINDGDYKLCIDASNVVSLTASKYLVDAHSTSTFVSTSGIKNGYYVIVEIDADGNIIRRDQTEKKYIYAVTSSKQVYDKGDTNYTTAMCTVAADGNPSKLDESKASEYILHKTTGDLVDYYIINSE